MPFYVYGCSQCGKQFEVEQRITADPLQDCECGGKGTLTRLIQPTAIMFKGSGFHINDYASKSTSTEPSSSPAAESKPSGDSGSSSSPAKSTETSSPASSPAPEASPKMVKDHG